MKIIKLTIEYDGTDFCGWQIQNQERTVQGEISKAISKIFQEDCTLIGSGRTDSGVHAKGQVAHFKTTSKMLPGEIQKALNANLPEDIVILDAEEVPAKFHAQYSAKSKTYSYAIYRGKTRSALLRRTSYYYPFPLNLALMKKESKDLIGKKDFRSFQATDPTKEEGTTVRTIKRIQILKRQGILTINIEANGFLYKMVRNIVGTLLEIGSGRLTEGSIKKILKEKDRTAAGKTAPAKGLSLMEVQY